MNIDHPNFYVTLIKRIYQFLLVHPEALRIEPKIQGDKFIFFIQGHATDQGLMIGSGGQNVKALQTIGRVIAQRARVLTEFKIMESWTGEKKVQNRPANDETWEAQEKDAPLVALLGFICQAMFENECLVEKIKHDTMENGESVSFYSMRFTKDLPPMDVQHAISTLFHAIGRARGRNIMTHARLEVPKIACQSSPAGGAPVGKVLGKVRKRGQRVSG